MSQNYTTHSLERRVHHGNGTHIGVMKYSDFLWVKPWQAFANQFREQCDAVIKKYEFKLMKYGYSLKAPHHRVRSELVEPYLTPQMGENNFNGH